MAVSAGIATMTRFRLTAFAVSLATVTTIGLDAQSQSPVDFRRDVQPILRDHCYACHGREQQMNGLRLDRRAAAMRGGTQSVIGPGNAEGSRLYHRLIGKSVGPQMPPTGPLGPEQIAVLKAWIDEGAEWPDDLASTARLDSAEQCLAERRPRWRGPDDASAVVDSALRVHGIRGLRVIDASIMPTITSGNTNSPTIMIAERGAQLVLRDN